MPVIWNVHEEKPTMASGEHEVSQPGFHFFPYVGGIYHPSPGLQLNLIQLKLYDLFCT